MSKSICICRVLLWMMWGIVLGAAAVAVPPGDESQEATTLTTAEEEADSEMAEATQSDSLSYNTTTDSPAGSITTMSNEYFGPSGTGSSNGGSAGTIPRDRMGPLNAYYHNLKDRPKSTEEVCILK